MNDVHIDAMAQHFLVEETARIHSTLGRTIGWRRNAQGQDGEDWQCFDLAVIWSVATESDQRVWMHVSLSRPDRLPSYADQARVKALFVGDDRYAFSVWAPTERHVNIHSRCLHLWAPLNGPLPLPDFTRGLGTI